MICLPDFDGYSFNHEDFDTSSIPYSAHKFLFDRLPTYFHEQDSYKDQIGRGILERFMSMFAEEVDQEIVPYIECYLNTHNAEIADEDFVNYISDMLGNPPDIFQDIEQYRKILSNAIRLYQVKGTITGYQLFFDIIGYGLQIVYLETITEKYYDSGLTYDTVDLNYKGCNPCYKYDLLITSKTGLAEDLILDSDIIAKLNSVVSFNQPINAEINKTILLAEIEDEIDVTVYEDEPSVDTLVYI